MHPKIGIITATYNRPELLKRAIDSVLNNGYTNWIMCIIDDCSENINAYKDVLSSYNDERIYYKRLENNSGLNYVRNKALDYLIDEKGCDYITILDDDDEFTPDALQTAVDMINNHPKYKWFVSRCVDRDMNEITKIDEYRELSYFDYLAWAGMRGDATHFISGQIIGSKRFEAKLKNEYQATFFIQLNTYMYLYDHISKIVEYLHSGLTKDNDMERSNDREVFYQIMNKYGVTSKKLKRRYFYYRLKKGLKEKDIYNILKYSVRYPFGI